MILRARAIFPISRPPIFNGAVVVSGNRLKAVGRWRDLQPAASGKVFDLGETVLMPGLVNAHCHLDYTHMAGQFPAPKLFIDWLKLITSTKAGWNIAEYESSWLTGARMLLNSGTTTVADIEAVPQLLPGAWQATPLRVVSFLEMIGITARRPPQGVLQEALDTIAALGGSRGKVGLSPHAPYSTVPQLLEKAAEVARQNDWPISIHVSESQTELDMFRHAKGEMFEWLKKSGRDVTDCGGGSPVLHLENCGLLKTNLLAIHANYLARGDVAMLARRNVSVVHCPRSHAYFRHEPFAIERLIRAGINVCIGTDSLASVVKTRSQPIELDMFAELRLLAQHHASLSPKKIIAMATINGARALRLPGRLGQLTAGSLADVIALPWAGEHRRLAEDIVQHRGAITASLIDGQWAVPPP